MYVCICRAVTERQVRLAVRDGVHTFKELRHALGVAEECGQCAGFAHRCLKEARESLRKEAKDTKPPP
jgi:bacterioferritin-associated ferredoxin